MALRHRRRRGDRHDRDDRTRRLAAAVDLHAIVLAFAFAAAAAVTPACGQLPPSPPTSPPVPPTSRDPDWQQPFGRADLLYVP
eukprot:SAG11_NODE_11487_length_757_cov_1.437690_2_plen_82_part_01